MLLGYNTYDFLEYLVKNTPSNRPTYMAVAELGVNQARMWRGDVRRLGNMAFGF